MVGLESQALPSVDSLVPCTEHWAGPWLGNTSLQGDPVPGGLELSFEKQVEVGFFYEQRIMIPCFILSYSWKENSHSSGHQFH